MFTDCRADSASTSGVQLNPFDPHLLSSGIDHLRGTGKSSTDVESFNGKRRRIDYVVFKATSNSEGPDMPELPNSTGSCGGRLHAPDLHPLLLSDNRPMGTTKYITDDICNSNSHSSSDLTPKARPGPPLVVPSESVPFCDKRRRLLATPLITGYYVSDRPPDGQSHNNRES